jgi:hypothetical protein
LKVSGSRSQENLDFYYQSHQPVVSKAQVFSDHPKTVGDISVKAEELQPINADKKHRLSGSEVVHANYRELRLTNGTKRQADLKDKILIISGNDGSDGEKYFLHQSLVENHLSGSIAGARAIIIAMPAYHPKDTLVETLKALTSPNLQYKHNDHGDYLLEKFPAQAFHNDLKPDLDKIKAGGLSYVFEPQGDGTSGTVTIKIENQDLIEQTRRERYEKGLNPFKEMLADAAGSYLPNTPVYLALDDKLVKNVNEGIGSGKLLVTEKSIAEKSDAFQKQRIDMEFAEEKEFKESKKPQISLDALDLVTLQKPSPSPKKSYVEKMVGTSKDGYYEI